MYEGAARVHIISAGKCKKSEMLYITWLNVVGVIPELFTPCQYILLFATVIIGITKIIFYYRKTEYTAKPGAGN